MSESESAELARLLEAMANGGQHVRLDKDFEDPHWVCQWIVPPMMYTGEGAEMYEAVRACWERGQS